MSLFLALSRIPYKKNGVDKVLSVVCYPGYRQGLQDNLEVKTIYNVDLCPGYFYNLEFLPQEFTPYQVKQLDRCESFALMHQEFRGDI